MDEKSKKKRKLKQKQKQKQTQSVVVNVNVGKRSKSGSKPKPRQPQQIQQPPRIYASPIHNLVPQVFSGGKQITPQTLEEQMKTYMKSFTPETEESRRAKVDDMLRQRTAIYEANRQFSGLNPEQFNTQNKNEPQFSEKASKENEFESLKKRKSDDSPVQIPSRESTQSVLPDAFNTPATRQLSDELNIVSESTGEPSGHSLITESGVLKQAQKIKKGRPIQTEEQKEQNRLRRIEEEEQKRIEDESPFESVSQDLGYYETVSKKTKKGKKKK
jgi:hypothetical protein